MSVQSLTPNSYKMIVRGLAMTKRDGAILIPYQILRVSFIAVSFHSLSWNYSFVH